MMIFIPKSILRYLFFFTLAVLAVSIVGVIPVKANNTTGAPPFSQNWSNAGLITVNDNWSGVTSIVGYRGDDVTTATGVNPQTLLAGDDAAPVVDVNVNQSNPNTNTTGGVTEFDGIGNPTIALQGSATADVPYIKIFLNTTGVNNVGVFYNVRDIDGSTDNAVQQVALQYRVGSSGNFTNIAAGYIADATTGPSLATLVTNINLILPAAVNNQSTVELRIMTTNAVGNDEWVGIDDISITANYAPTGFSLAPASVLENKPAGTVVGALSAVDTLGDTHTFTLVNSALCAGNGAENSNFSIAGNSLSTTTSFDFETKSSYQICVTVTDNNNLSFTGEQTVTITDIPDETPPTVSLEQAAGQLDPTNVSPINFTVVFSEPVAGFDGSNIVLGGTSGAAIAVVSEIAPNDGTTYIVAVSGMAAGGTVTADITAGAATDASGNVSVASFSIDKTVTYSTDTIAPHVLFSAKTIPANNSVLFVSPQIQIEFDEDIKNDGSAGAANNVANFLLVEAGANTLLETASCAGGRAADDVKITVNAVAYNNNGGSGPFLAALSVNGNAALAPSSYRLFVCGTTSIEDLLGNKLNNGSSDTLINFTVSQVASALDVDGVSVVKLPATGFPVGQITRLPAQPADKAYASFSDLWLEIPKLKVSTSIVGVPLSKDGWDVTWLGAEAGWLNETAFPTWAGNSVITAHVWDAFNQPGTFYNLKKLGYGDVINIHAFGQVYVYEVRQTKRIDPDNFSMALKHEDKAWLSLITCEDYRLLFRSYNYRRLVRAVLVNVVDEK